jgi:hypothetical protein
LNDLTGSYFGKLSNRREPVRSGSLTKISIANGGLRADAMLFQRLI